MGIVWNSWFLKQANCFVNPTPNQPGKKPVTNVAASSLQTTVKPLVEYFYQLFALRLFA
jgi:hypothetical protein